MQLFSSVSSGPGFSQAVSAFSSQRGFSRRVRPPGPDASFVRILFRRRGWLDAAGDFNQSFLTPVSPQWPDPPGTPAT